VPSEYKYQWKAVQGLQSTEYSCGYCGCRVGADKGYSAAIGTGVRGEVVTGPPDPVIRICPVCTCPSFFDTRGVQTPAPRIGRDVQGITDTGVVAVYDEARRCTSVAAYTAAVAMCRKVLMHVAVHCGDAPNKRFVEYVDYLATNGFVPPNGKGWVDQVRKKGNEASHEIRTMTKADAEQILKFTEMLLRYVYEGPSMVS